MTTMTPTEPTITRNAQAWEILLEQLQDDDEPESQLAALRVLTKLADRDIEEQEIPIAQLTEVLLTQTTDEDGTLYVGEDEDLWSEGLDLLERFPDAVPLEPVITALCLAWQNDTSSSQALDLIARLEGITDPGPFVALVADPDPQVRQAGLEALYQLKLADPMLPLLVDPDPDTRALAMENAWCLQALTLPDLQQYATDPRQPEVVRAKAQEWLDQAAKAEE